MTTIIKAKAKTGTARLRLAAANGSAAIAIARHQVKPEVMQGRAEALRRLEAIIAEGETSIAELEAILPLLEGHALRLLEDVVGTVRHVQRGGRGNWFAELQGVASELRDPRHQYQPGRGDPVPYLPLG